MTRPPLVCQIFATVVLMLKLGTPAEAANYNVTNVVMGPGDTLIANFNNVPISGGIATIGYFPAAFDVDANIGNISQLIANFTVAGSSRIGAPSASLGGAFPGYFESDVFDGPIVTTGNPLLGRRLYSFNGNASTLGGSTLFSLVRLETIKDDVPNEKDYNFVVTNSSQVLLGSLGTVNGDFGGGVGIYKTLKFDDATPMRSVMQSVANPAGCSVSGLGSYPYLSSAVLTATPAPGYVFSGWTGSLTGTENPLTLVVDGHKVIDDVFAPDVADPDKDELSNYEELVVYQTDPNVADTDGDGFSDGFEVHSGFSPKSATSSPELQSAIRTAVEFEFSAASGVSYRIEESADGISWTTIEPVIDGQGSLVTRLYSTKTKPVRFFRAMRN